MNPVIEIFSNLRKCFRPLFLCGWVVLSACENPLGGSNFSQFDPDHSIGLETPGSLNLSGTPGPGEVTLFWTPALNATVYEVHVRDPIRETFEKVAEVSQLSITLRSLNGALPYTFKVLAKNGKGSWSSNWISIQPHDSSATSLQLSSVPSATIAGSSFSVTVTAKDASGNTATSYSGSVNITSSDAAAVLPASATLSSGVGVFNITLKTAGSKTITATDGTLSSAASTLDVTGSAYSLAQSILTPAASTVNSGSSVKITLDLKDPFGNTPSAGPNLSDLSFESSLVGGTGIFSAITQTGPYQYSADFTGAIAGSVTLTAKNASNDTSPSLNLVVNPGPAATIHVFSGNNQTGKGLSPLTDVLIAQLKDISGNLTTHGTVSWSVGIDGSTSGRDYGSLADCATTPASSAGRVQCSWILGTFIGTQVAEATLPNGQKAQFNATGQYPNISAFFLNGPYPDPNYNYWYNDEGTIQEGGFELRVQNTGTTTATGCRLLGDYSGSLGTNCQTLPPGGACSAFVNSRGPDPSADAPRSEDFTFSCDYGGSGTATALTEPLIVPEARMDQARLVTRYSSVNVQVGETKDVTLQISNTANYPMMACSTSFGAMSPVSSTCSSSLEAGSSCQAIFRFNGDHSNQTAILYMNCRNSLVEIGVHKNLLSGTLTGFTTVSDADFGLISLGSPSTISDFYFHNSGDYRVTGCNAPIVNGAYSIVQDECGTSELLPHTRCRVRVSANPFTTTTFNGTLSRTCLYGGSASFSLVATGMSDRASTVPSAVPVPSPWTQPVLSSGYWFNCTLTNEGRVLCWGDNARGNLGNGTGVDSDRPVLVSGIDGSSWDNIAVSLVLRHQSACALMKSGSMKCWGHNSNGQLGKGDTFNANVPGTVSGIDATGGATTRAIGIAVGSAHTCAILQNYSVSCWGSSTFGQTGVNIFGGYILTPAPVTALNGIIDDKSIVSLAAGEHHTCAISISGKLYCWGKNADGQLGIGNSTDQATPQAVALFDGLTSATTAKALALGSASTCALTAAGTVLCWGANNYSQLGDNTSTNRTLPSSSFPVKVSASTTLSNVSQISGYGMSANNTNQTFCATDTSGFVYCWGNNFYSQLGDGTNTKSALAKKITSLSGITQVSVGLNNVCATRNNGAVYCWGKNGVGELGVRKAAFVPVPQNISFLSQAKTIAFNGSGMSCASMHDGTVKCWGAGALGNGTTGYAVNPVTLSLTGIESLEGGGSANSLYARNSSGSVFQWGLSFGASNIATQNANLSSTLLFSGGAAHICRVNDSKTANCWGTGVNGQLGNGLATTNNTPPGSTVSGLNNITSIASGNRHSCATLMNGEVWCWGTNSYGQLGNGTAGGGTLSPVPVQVIGINSATAVTASDNSSCALLNDQSVVCWGYNGRGELGNGTNSHSSVPTVVSLSAANVVKMVGGTNHFCALRSTGRVICWGSNAMGELGNPEATRLGNTSTTTTSSNVPLQVPALVDVVNLFAGVGNTVGGPTCAITLAGQTWCWGENTFSNAGTDETAIRRVNGL